MNIKVEIKKDEYADYKDYGDLGYISDQYHPRAIKRILSELPYYAREDNLNSWYSLDYYYYIPTDNYQGTHKWLVEHGYSKHEAAMAEKSYYMQDLKRLLALYRGDWCYIGIVVTVEHEGIELGSASLWGIESDTDYKDEIEDLKSEALAEAEEHYNNLVESFKVPISELEIDYDENLS